MGKVLAPQVGFEPTTDRLTADCSTTELLRSVAESMITLAIACYKFWTQAALLESWLQRTSSV